MSTPESLEMIKAMRRLFIQFPHVKRATDRFESVMSYECLEDEEADCIMLVGLPGVGKSSLISQFCKKYRRKEHETYTEIPVLHVSVGANCNILKLAGAMLRGLGSEFWNKGDDESRTVQLIKLLKECRVKLVILDEINHLVDRGGKITHHKVADWIKQMTNEVRVPFVLAGNPRALKLNHTNDQTSSRFSEVIPIEPFSLKDDAEEKVFRSVINIYEGIIKDLPAISLSEKKILRKIAIATDGRVRMLRKLLVGAVEIAYQQPNPKLTEAVLSDAFKQRIFKNATNQRNPFHKNFNGIPLNRPREPYSLTEID